MMRVEYWDEDPHLSPFWYTTLMEPSSAACGLDWMYPRLYPLPSMTTQDPKKPTADNTKCYTLTICLHFSSNIPCHPYSLAFRKMPFQKTKTKKSHSYFYLALMTTCICYEIIFINITTLIYIQN